MSDVKTRWLDDRTLQLETLRPDGLLVTCEVGWPTTALAAEHADDAIRLFTEKHLADVPRQIGQKSKTWRFRWLYITVVSGPPTWWLPNVHVHRNRVAFGWLRRGVVLSRR